MILNEDLKYIAETEYIPWELLRGRTVLVTGATGFVGSLLCRALLTAEERYGLGIRVLALVRDPAKADRVLAGYTGRKALRYVTGDITVPVVVEENVDYIVHCASVTTSRTMVEQPVETLQTSLRGTENMLELAKAKQVQSFVYVSSMEMYGTFQDREEDVREEDQGYIDPLAVRSNYPLSKRLCENMCIAYLREYGVPVTIARLAQTFGAGVAREDRRIYAQIAGCVIRKEDIVLHTRGLSEGNYCYSADVIRALLLLLLKGARGEAYNVANPATHTTIAGMAEMVCDRIAGGAIKVVYDIPAENTYGYAADTKLKLNSDKLQALGWRPKADLEEMYRRMIASLHEECREADCSL